ncbi:AAA family ATPase [Lichenicoccus sp.]|uniref:AAA family ATPase n=1 Tax=Lichenicoccus sp. TaxID=2781899 RepID=UPI003D0CC24D
MSVRFARLRIAGFKSFAEPVSVDILPGLTGIVGPNGCGKSNVVEALRWTMGESSARSLRGGEMDDLIFAGTAGRPARNLAEVTLTLEEAAGIAPPPFDDQPELQISRRIERGAGSAYRVNGREMRARDVQTLFADLASGARSSAMVSQGRVSTLVNARPEERRSILEEAAGITGLHARRHEAELKLRATEANLARAEDLRLQLETRLSELDVQSRQARRYREVAAGLREAEAGLLALLHARARAAVAQARAATAATDAALSAAGQRAELATIAEHAAELALPRPREAEAMARTSLERCRIAAETLASEEQRVARELVDAQARLSRARAEAQAAAARLADAEQALAALEVELAAAERRRSALPERRQAALQAHQDAQAGLAAANAAHAEAVAGENTLRSRSGQLEREHAAAANSLDRLSAQLAALRTDHDAAAASLPAETERAALQAACEQAASALEQAAAAAEQASEARNRAARDADLAGLQAADASRAHAAAVAWEAEASLRAARLAAELATIASEIAGAQAGRLAEQDAADGRQEVSAQETRLERLRHGLAAAETARAEAQEAHATTRSKAAEARALHEQASAATTSAAAMQGRATDQHEQIVRDTAAAEAILVPQDRLDRSASQVAGIESVLDAARAALAASEQSREEGERENAAAGQRLASILAEQARLQAQLDGLAPGAEEPAPDAENWQHLADVMTVPPGLERAIGAVLADGLDAALDPAAPRYWRDLERGSPVALPAGATPLAGLLDAPAALVFALSHAGLVEEADGSVLQVALQPGQALVSRSGSLWRWDGYSDTGGLSAETTAARAARALEQRNRLRETNARLEAAAGEADDARTQAEIVARTLADRVAAAGEARIRRDEAEAALSAAREDHRALHGQADAAGARLDALVPQRDRAGQALHEAEQALAAARSQREALPVVAALELSLDQARLREAEAVAAESQAREARRQAEQRLEGGRRKVAEHLARQAETESRLNALRPQHLRIAEDERTAREELAAAGEALPGLPDPQTGTLAAARLREAARTAEALEYATRAEWRDVAARLERLQEERSRLNTRLVEQRSRMEALAPRLAALASERQDALDALARAQAARDQLPGLDAAAAAAAEASARLEAAWDMEAACRDAQLRLASEGEALETEVTRLAGARADWSRRAAAAREDCQAARARLAADQASHDALAEAPALAGQHRRQHDAALADAVREHRAAKQTLDESDQALLDAQNERRSADASLMQAREARLRLQGRNEQAEAILAQLLAETPPKTPQEAPHETLTPDDLSDNAEASLRRRVARLARECHEMGPVNLRADIESGEAQARADTILRECRELEAAIARLRGSIGHLNREGRERLLAVLEQVDRNFQTLFARMFNGGRAHLGMVGNDDPLQAGLEIYAQPPGKKLATLSLLSGGEQALTALSLIFAVFRCNPAPVCVLDEVDAPLDDANVERFCALLADMVAETGTRFLVVTHHQLTMAHMDRLYGVTMQERGVSRLLSVDLAAASEMTERQREPA